MNDMAAKGREWHGDKRGDLNPAAKITEADVRKIRALYATGQYRQIDLARRFGLTQWPISAIIRRKTWKHVSP